MNDTDHCVHLPDGKTFWISYRKLLQPDETFHREGEEWRVTGVELREGDEWHVFVEAVEE